MTMRRLLCGMADADTDTDVMELVSRKKRGVRNFMLTLGRFELLPRLMYCTRKEMRLTLGYTLSYHI